MIEREKKTRQRRGPWPNFGVAVGLARSKPSDFLRHFRGRQLFMFFDIFLTRMCVLLVGLRDPNWSRLRKISPSTGGGQGQLTSLLRVETPWVSSRPRRIRDLDSSCGSSERYGWKFPFKVVGTDERRSCQSIHLKGIRRDFSFCQARPKGRFFSDGVAK